MTTKPPFIVAEMSANHLGDPRRAEAIVKAAAEAGADAIKFQTWKPDTMCLDRGYVIPHGPWQGRSLFELYRQAHTPWEWHEGLFDYARQLGLVPFSAAFDRESVDFLEGLGVDRHKVASFELTDIPLIAHMADTGKPLILSTGMADEQDLAAACIAATLRDDGAPRPTRGLTLLVCTSSYPAPEAEAHLRRLLEPHEVLDVPVDMGLSDHTLGPLAAVVATARGATYIEKHLTLSRADGGPDAGFSLEPPEFKDLVDQVRRAHALVGEWRWGPKPSESTELRRSLWVARDTRAGAALVLHENIRTARPARGLPPATDLAGKVAARDLTAGTPLTAEDLS